MQRGQPYPSYGDPCDGNSETGEYEMTRFKTIAGVLCVLIGVIWILQGANLMGGSFMTGQTQWLVIGIVVAIVGAVLLASGRRPR